MYTIMFWIPKDELRAIRVDNDRPPYNPDFRFLPEHRIKPPIFTTSEEAFAYIAEYYPHMHP